MIYQTAAVLALAGAASATLYSSDMTHQKYMWETYKTEYKRDYSPAEDVKRFGIFVENLKIADQRNIQERKNGGTAIHGITKFTDLAQDEFARGFLGSKAKRAVSNADVRSDLPPPRASGLVDWSSTLCTPIKNQGYCGGCWGFSATEQIESDTIRTLSTTYILSPEQVIQCDKTSQGCNGGWTEHAYDYVKNTGGIETESAYPYTSYSGTTGSCHSSSANFVVSLKSYTTIKGATTADTESQMASYVQSTGPLSVCLDASTWNSYTTGIMSAASCGTDVDHCVQAVGVDTSDGYWKVRNQWGTTWGEAGYIQLQYGANACDITNDPTYTVVALK